MPSFSLPVSSLQISSLTISDLNLSLMEDRENSNRGFWSDTLQVPFNFLARTLRQYTPNLVSLFVFFLLIPFLGFVSLSAGLIIWRNVAVGWQVPLYLQYGYVLLSILILTEPLYL